MLISLGGTQPDWSLAVTSTKVLDHGHIILMDHMPNNGGMANATSIETELMEWPQDYAIIEAARASYGNSLKTPEEDRKLLRYLMKHNHTSPFEMVEFKFEIQMPIFLARQWMRYRTANVNEISGRYAQLEPMFYRPDDERLNNAMQCPKNKQSSAGPVSEAMQKEFNEMLDMGEKIHHSYENLVSQGMAKEVARMGLPLNLYTRFVWKNDLHNIMNLLGQRLSPEAQWEIREYAKAMLELIRPVVPWTIEEFEKTLDNEEGDIA